MPYSISTTSVISDIHVTIPAYSNNSSAWSVFQNDARSITTVDLNNDGYLDIFVHPSYFTGGDALAPIALLNDGNGGFIDGTAAVFRGITPTIYQSNGVFIGSFTNDGRLGMFVVDQGLEVAGPGGFGGAINHFYLQDTAGDWQDLTANLPGNGKSFNHVSSMVDFNGDGNLDILVTRLGGANFEGSGTFLYLGDGKGGFAMSTAGLPTEIRYTTNDDRDWNSKTLDYQYSGASHAADLDGDGRTDLIAGSYTDGDHLTGLNTVRVYTQTVNHQFAEAYRSALPDALKAQAGVMGVAGIDTADLDHDGRTDIVVRWENQSWTAVEILKNLGNDRFQEVATDMLGSYLARSGAVVDSLGVAQPTAYALVLDDVDHDGNIDLLLQNFNSNAKQLATGTDTGLYLNDGQGHLVGASIEAGSRPTTAQTLMDLAGTSNAYLGTQLTFDVDNDGIDDLVYLSGTNSNIHVATLHGTTSGQVYSPRLGESLVASSGNDTIRGGIGNTHIDGGAGIDTLIEPGNRADYVVTREGGGFELSHGGIVEHITAVERIGFADGGVALDIGGTGGQIFRLYQAAYDRAPDPAGVGFWIDAADRGSSMQDIAGAFTHSAEFVQLYGAGVDDADYLTHLYQNVLHRPGEQAGFDFWLSALHAGTSREAVLSSFAESAENVAALAGAVENGFDYVPFHSV